MYCNLINPLVSARVSAWNKERRITGQPPINFIHVSASFIRSFPFDLTPLMHHQLWRERAFIAGTYVGQTSRLRHGMQAYFAYCREVRPFDVVTTKPPGLHLDSLSRQLPMGNGGKAVAFDSPLTVSYRLGWGRILQAVGCLTCQVNHRQPLSSLALLPTLLQSPFPPRYHSLSPSQFTVAPIVISRAPLRYPHAAISTRRVLIRNIMLQ